MLTRCNCLYRSANAPNLLIARNHLGTAQGFVESLHRKLSESRLYLSCHVDAAQTHIAEVIGYVSDRPRPDFIVQTNSSSHFTTFRGGYDVAVLVGGRSVLCILAYVQI